MVRHLSRAGICGDLCIYFSAAPAGAAAALFLGRSWVLRSGGARHTTHRKFDSSFHSFQWTSAAGDDLGAVVGEGGGLCTIGDPDGNAGCRGLLASGCVSAGGARGEYTGCDCLHALHRALSGVLRAEFACPRGSGRGGAYLLGSIGLCGGGTCGNGMLVRSRGAGERDGDSGSCWARGLGGCWVSCAQKFAADFVAERRGPSGAEAYVLFDWYGHDRKSCPSRTCARG